MGTREGGRRPEGGNKSPRFIPLGGPSVYAAWWHFCGHYHATEKEEGRDVACNVSKIKGGATEPSNHAAWRATQSQILHGKKSLPPLAGDGVPMKKCSHFFHGYPGRWPKAGRGGIKTQDLSCLASPACILLAARLPEVNAAPSAACYNRATFHPTPKSP